MKPYSKEFTDIRAIKAANRKPDFSNLLSVLKREVPSRFTLFEFIINNNKLLDLLTEGINYDKNDPLYPEKRMIDAYHAAGYDFACVRGRSFGFWSNRHKQENKDSLSLNEGYVITDRKSFEAYNFAWPEESQCNWLADIEHYIPDGMKLLVPGPDGVLETVLSLTGYDNICYMLADDPELVTDIFTEVGSKYVRYYEMCTSYDFVGAMMADDDWGFNTQTFLSDADMRKYVIPWHVKIAEAVHNAKKPMTFHSCGNISRLMDDVINVIKHDGWHSFEDNILPVEDAYEKYGGKDGKIAILGGIDMDFLCRSTPKQVYQRSCAMLERSKNRGGYALGAGNSVPDYVPVENYLAMISAAVLN